MFGRVSLVWLLLLAVGCGPDEGAGDVTADAGIATTDGAQADASAATDGLSLPAAPVCRPCKTSPECGLAGAPGALCVDHGAAAGAFCGLACATHSDCPDGYGCLAVTLVEGGTAKQCVPDTAGDAGKFGDCNCALVEPGADFTTTCWFPWQDDSGQVIGQCKGQRSCTAAGPTACAAIGDADICVHTGCLGVAEGSGCDDGDPCTQGDACKSGKCVAGANTCLCQKAEDCADDDDLCNGIPYCDTTSLPYTCKINPATVVTCAKVDAPPCQANACQPGTGKCAVGAVVDGTPCDDGDVCTADELCTGGACGSGKGICVCKTDADCAAVDDGNLCNGVLFCHKTSGTCQPNPASVVVCASVADHACLKNLCSPTVGKCAWQPTADGTPCDDGSPCTDGDDCEGGKCSPGTQICPCAKDVDCVTKDDGDLCNGTLYCGKGDDGKTACLFNPATVVVCPSVDDTACLKNTCIAKTGACQAVPLAGKVTCDDGNPCTSGDVCVDGDCDSSFNTCQCASTKDCAKHEDGDLCNGTLYCHKATGSCRVNPATIPTCPSVEDTACVKNRCQAKTGGCKPTAQIEETPCDDGNPCSAGDRCLAGNCIAEINVCPCQKDVDCAKHEDGNLCNGSLVCIVKLVDGKVAPRCEVAPNTVVFCKQTDPSLCTKPFCAPLTGICSPHNANTGLGCDDGDACTESETCKTGTCSGVAVTGATCSDGNACTTDSCHKTKGCQHQAVADGSPCGAGKSCKAGVCGNVDPCGNGKVQGAEECDDGDKKPGDGCSADCKLETCALWMVSTLAGDGSAGYPPQDGKGKAASFYYPTGIDVAGNGDVYVSDRVPSRIRRISPAGVVLTVAGSKEGLLDGDADKARFDEPCGLAVGANGDVLIADRNNMRIRKLTTKAQVSTLAGTFGGFANGKGSNAKFFYPMDLARVGEAFYVADMNNNRIRSLASDGTVGTLAGAGDKGSADGAAGKATFNGPAGVAASASGHVWVADSGNHLIRHVSPAGAVDTVAGSKPGFLDGKGSDALFHTPSGIAIDTMGRVFVADRNNHRIRLIRPDGATSTAAGNAAYGYADDKGPAAKFLQPEGVAVSKVGLLYVADTANNRIRRIQCTSWLP